MDSEEVFEMCRRGLLHPEAYSICRLNIAWEVFGSLTFPRPLRYSRRCKMFLHLIRSIAALHRLHFSELRWILRHEQHRSGDPHLHFVLEGLSEPTSPSINRQIKNEWMRISGGLSHIKAYNSSKNGFVYTMKAPRVTSNSSLWDTSTEVEISHSIQRQFAS
jgi:hypothetical protein